jgi:Xaa-Pro aminopeptidase
MTELTVKVPDELASQLEAAGLLDEAVLEKVFRDALRKQAVGELFVALDEIQSLKLPPMTEAEIQAEIDAARAERRARTGK